MQLMYGSQASVSNNNNVADTPELESELAFHQLCDTEYLRCGSTT